MSNTSIAGPPVPAILVPDDVRALMPSVDGTSNPRLWVYRYTHPVTRWRLSIATHAAPGSGQLSLGGFRIAPLERTSAPGFDTDREAIGLAIGMEEKVRWSRLMGIGGPLALRDSGRIVGGKCVLQPSADARIGQPNDVALLDFAIACFNDAERRGGFRITTGQDLGHGAMHDTSQTSLQYLNERFKGSVVADTSLPTGEGNFLVVEGMLRAFDIPLERATVGLIGCGNIGMHILRRLRGRGAAIHALESNDTRRREVAATGAVTYAPSRKRQFLGQPFDALVVNAAGGSLDDAALDEIVKNNRIKIVCGSENLVMPDHAAGSARLVRARKVYAPTELGGMMGYLTAVEEYLARLEGMPFDLGTMFEAARKLEPASYAATRLVIDRDFDVSFEDAVTERSLSSRATREGSALSAT